MSTKIKITTELLYKAALVFALMDAVYVPLLVWRVKETAFRRWKWPLVIAAAGVWFGIWGWAIGNFWETVYVYVMPPWARIWAPWIALAAAGLVALGLWALSLRVQGRTVLVFCLGAGALGGLTHIWAVHLGIVTKPPMLQGASPPAAVTIAVFEYIFYWCTILVIAGLIDWARIKMSACP